MMKQLTILFTLLFVSVFSFAQQGEIIQYEEIQKNIEDKTSPYYYPELLKRYKNADETLTNEDYRHLYYGFTFQDNYKPYERNPLDLQITELLPGASTEEDFKKLRTLTLEYLEQDPFSLKLLNYLENFNYNLPEIDPEENIKLKRQYNGIIQAIISTGDGRSIKTGFTVNQPSDEYMFMRSLGLKPTSSTIETAYDKFQLAENENGMSEIFFDVHRMATVGTKQLGVTTVEVKAEDDPKLSADGLIIGSEDELLAFTPAGATVLYQGKGDIDEDGDSDWVFVTGEGLERETSNFADGHPKYRKFFILTRQEDGTLSKFESKKVVPCIDCGGTSTDPLTNIELGEGTITIHSKGGELIKWERVTEFRFFEGEWHLLKEEFSSYRKGKEDKKKTEIETPEDFGKITLKEFDYYKMLE